MRLCRLCLGRFGPFTDTTLDFGPSGGRLELVYGPNEAGKSTTLRAVSGLLYGIPLRTPDGHLHPMQELRLSGELVCVDGRVLSLDRIKSSKSSLRSEGKPLEESVLARFLGGVTQATFLQTFGLNHLTLREGGHALLEGRGEMGVSLFDAAMGGAGALSVLGELEKEAAQLYNPRGRVGVVNRALSELSAAKLELKRATTLPQSFLDQRAELSKKQEELARVEARRRELRAEAEQLRFARELWPRIVECDEIARKIAEIGAVPSLAEDFTSRRESTVRESELLRHEISHFETALEIAQDKRQGISVPERLAAVESDRVNDLTLRLGGHHDAEVDLPKRRAELATLERDQQRLEQKLGRAGAEGGLDAATKERLTGLALSHGKLFAAVERNREDLVEQREGVKERTRALAEHGDPLDTEELKGALKRAVQAGDPERARAELELELTVLERAARALVRELGLDEDSPDRAVELEAPALETVERWQRDLDQAERERLAVKARLDENADRLATAERDLAALVRAGSVPSESDLALVRQKRDAAWQSVKSVLLAAKKPKASVSALIDGHEQTTTDSDEIADRLRREAERVAKLATTEAERDSALTEEARLLANAEAGALAEKELLLDWNQLWPRVVARSPREMLVWLSRRQKLVEKLEESAQLRDRHAAIESEIEQHTVALERVLHTRPVELSLRSWIDVAESELSLRRERAERRTALEAAVADKTLALARTDARAREAEAKLAAWQTDWGRAVARIGLEPDASPEEVNAVVAVLTELEQKRQQVRGMRERIESMEREAEQLRRHVDDLVAEYAPDLATQKWPLAAHELARRHADAMKTRAVREELDGQVAAAETKLAECRERLLRAEAELSVLLLQAKVDDVAALPEVEARVRAARQLGEARTRSESHLSELLAGRDLDSAREQILGVDLAEAPARLADIEQEQEELQRAVDDLRADERSIGEGLSRLENSTAAFEAKADEQQRLAQVRTGVERYLKLTLAAHVLGREIERYREKHQGPVLERANDLFRRLTIGRYTGVRPDVDSEGVAMLRAVRGDGVLVDMKGLSDGLRDQLYLALRLATLEHYASASEPLPLVLDDVLVHFDNERAQAALEVLAEVAQKMQVLLFTHDAHVVSLARAAVSPDRLFVSELERREFSASGESLATVH